MGAWYSLAAVLILAAAVLTGSTVGGLQFFLGVVLPLAAIVIFLAGMVARVLRWASSPVPFRITTTCGQEKSLPWIKQNKLDNPSSLAGVLGRMGLEVLLFRSLFRNTKAEMRKGPQLVYGENKWLWFGAIAFHYSFLVIFLRHLKFFTEPVPRWVAALGDLDGFFQISVPAFYLTDAVILAALLYLLGRRLADRRVRYLSLPSDYFALFLLLGIAVSGILMRYFYRVDIVAVKELAMGLVTFHPAVPAGVGPIFFLHLALVSTLLIYFPFSKLMHAPGVFLSPTRNLANNNRMVRHVNPWNYPVKVHTYAEWEEEFHDKIKAAGLPLEKE
jgi:nitrate reductase gamma subunit